MTWTRSRGLPDVVGRIERRVLLDHHVDPEEAAAHLPDGLVPRLLDGRAVVGVCLIRLVDVRPEGLPAQLGRTIEAAAHRISVEQLGPDGRRPGVFVPRRDTSSWAAVAAGGRLWPGVHHHATIHACRTATDLAIDVRSTSGGSVAADLDLRDRHDTDDHPADDHPADDHPADDHRATGRRSGATWLVDPVAVSAFHADELIAWSPSRRGGLEVVEMTACRWATRSIGVTATRSTWLDDPSAFPVESRTLAGALLMEDIDVRWRTVADEERGTLAATATEAVPVPG